MGKVRARVERDLILHVRQLAWLNATPKPPEGSKRAARSAKAVSRLAALKAQKVTPALPPVDAPHLVNRLIEIGLTGSTGMGVVPLSWAEIVAWQQATGLLLEPWESRIIRAMSSAYVAEGHRAEAETCPPPWAAPVTQSEIDTEDARLRSVLG